MTFSAPPRFALPSVLSRVNESHEQGVTRVGRKPCLILSVSAEFLGEAGFVACGEQFGLLDPLIAGDAPGETAELRIDAGHVLLAPRGDLGEGGDPEFAEQRGDLGAEALDARQIVCGGGGRRRSGRGGRFWLLRSRSRIDQRLIAARNLLAMSNPGPMSDIAYRFGFSDQAQFSRLFKAMFGQTPSGYRASLTGR